MALWVACAAMSAAAVVGGAPAAAAAPSWELRAMSVPGAWSASQGDGVTVAVVDSGIRTDHKVLAGRATEGPDLLNETDQGESWYGAHGTAMASHVLDVAPKAKVLGLRVIRDEDDPDYEEKPDAVRKPDEDSPQHPIANAIVYAADSGAAVISLSLGTADSSFFKYSSAEATAITYAISKGAVVVAAAGNEAEEDESNQISYPANYAGVIAVGASTKAGKRADFSQVHSYVDIVAPGQDVMAADFKTDGRKRTQGTSSATALVAGVAALITSAHPDLAPWQVEQALQRTASHYDQGHDAWTGYGRVDAAAALEAAAGMKPEPPLLSAVKHQGPAHLGPGDDGTPMVVNQPVETEMVVWGGIIAIPGLAAILIGMLLFFTGRRASRSSTTPPSGPPAFGPGPHPRATPS